MSNNPTNIIILASEITKGMKSVGPKCLLDITTNKRIVDYQIQFFKKYYKNININICVGFEQDKVIKYVNSKHKNITFISQKYYDQDNQLGSLIRCLSEYNMSNALVINNGILLGSKLKIKHQDTCIFTINSSRKCEFNIGCHATNSSTKYLFYDLPQKWIECVYLNQSDIKLLIDTNKKSNIYNLFLFEGLNIIANNKQLAIEPITRSGAMKINSIKDLQLAKKYYDKHILT